MSNDILPHSAVSCQSVGCGFHCTPYLVHYPLYTAHINFASVFILSLYSNFDKLSCRVICLDFGIHV